MNSGLKLTPSAMSVSDFLEYWITNYCEINLKETSVAGYRKKIKNIIEPGIGKFKMSSVSAPVLQKFLNDVFNQGYSRNTLICVKGIISKSFKYAKKQNIIQYNPAVDIELPLATAKPKVKEKKKPHCYIHNDLKLEKFDYHSLRHTHCSDLLSAGVPPKSVQKRLGHKDIATTLNIYQHITEEMENAEKNIIDHIYK